MVVDTPAQGLTLLASELDADLLVVGTHGRSGLTRWVLGSVAEGVVRQAPCAVLVIPPELHDPRELTIAPACPRWIEERRATAGCELWCEQHRPGTDERTPTTSPTGWERTRTCHSSCAEQSFDRRRESSP